MKTVLFVPGGGEYLHSRDYAAVLQAIESKGYKTKFVPITWPRTTIYKWVAELTAVYEKHDPADTILAGFSWGSMTAFVVAAERPPAELWLFSLSPYFAEDIPYIKHAWLKSIGKHRQEQFKRTSFDTLAPKITCPVKLFAGQKELQKWPETARRFREASRQLQHCKSIKISGVGHAVDHPHYIAAIKANI